LPKRETSMNVNKIGRIYLLVYIFISLLFSHYGQAKEINFRKIDMNSGLSFNSVMCIMEDSEGYLWIGTREGLNRYDGYEFEIFKHNPYDSTSLSNSHINHIFEDSNHTIWIGTSNGLNKYHPKTNGFSKYLAPRDSSSLSNNYVKTIIENNDKKIWIGTSNGISIYSPETNKFNHLYLETTPTYSNNIISLFKDVNDLIWIGTKGGLYLWENGITRHLVVDPDIETGNEPFEIRDIKQGNDGVYWIATEMHGIYCVSYSSGELNVKLHWHTDNSNIASNQVRRLLVEDSSIWLATLSGLSIYDISSKDFNNILYSFEKPDGISRGSIHDILKDQFNGYWIATYSGGLNYYNKQNNLFDHYKRTSGNTNGLSENDVNGFLEDEKGSMWVTTGRGLNHFDLKTGKFKYYSDEAKNQLSNRIIKSIASDAEGNLWIGTYDGLNFYDKKQNKFKQFYHIPDQNSLNQNQVHALHLDEDGLLWIGMNIGELQTYNPMTNRFTEVPNVGNIVSYIYEDSHNNLWIGTRSGLKCINRITKEPIDISKIIAGFESELLFINWITEDSSGRLWLGTQSSGLFLIEDKKLHWLGQNIDLNISTINAILEDNEGYLWISTNGGITKLEYKENDKNDPSVNTINFTKAQGLQGPQFNPGSAYKASDGKFYFGGINGFNAFYPDSIKKKTLFPKVIITKLQIHSSKTDQDIEKTNKITHLANRSTVRLKYNQRNISLSFSGINFVNPEGTEYRYKLKGRGHGWIYTKGERMLNFSYLPIGEHNLDLQASTDPFVWGEDITTLKIIVLPPWWLSNYAYVSYFIIFILLLYLFFHFSQRWARLKNKLSMEQVIHEKEQRMYESKLEFFTDISHELRTPLTLILAPLEKIMQHTKLPNSLNTDLLMIERNGRKMMEMINQVLNLRQFETGQFGRLKATHEDFVHFIKELTLSFKPLATSRNIDFICQIKPEKLKMWFDNNKLEIVIFNLLSNAFKHAPENGTVKITVTTTNQLSTTHRNQKEDFENYVIIAVRDNGEGIPQNKIKGLFQRFYTTNNILGNNPTGIGIGLNLTKRMVELHHGHIEVESQIESEDKTGFTEFIVYLPIINKPNKSIDQSSQSDENENSIPEEQTLVWQGEDISNIELPTLSDDEKQTLLIVEDNEEVRFLIKGLFDSHYIVEEASDGQEGYELALKKIPDLIISDIMMPNLNGIELCQRLKTDIRTSHIPIILLTARATVAYKYEGYETGADAYITKPFSSNYLILRVKNLIKQRNNIKAFIQREALIEPESVIINSVDDKLLKKAVEFINQNISDSSLSVEQISNELALSRMHFHRKIKSITGQTPAEFVRNIRLKKAAAILKQNKLSIKETIDMVGFENADHFRKWFKEVYGLTPSDYQNSPD